MPKVIPVILSGGKGTRLWPLSRESYPKQFLPLLGENEQSLLQETICRIVELDDVDDPIIICNEEHRFLVAEQMRGIGITPKAIILENEGRNTAPAITLGAIKASELVKEDSLLLILSADHMIGDIDVFHRVLMEGFKYAERENLVTFGIVPDYAETGYGYIESEFILDTENIIGSKVKKFIEKPNKDLAKEFIKSKKYTWNSGMFVFKTSLIIRELEEKAPMVIKQCREAMIKSNSDLDFTRVDPNSFSKAPNISIDVAVMEKTDYGLVIPLNAGWSDIGNWKSLWDKDKKDFNGNVVKGKVFNFQSSKCYLRAENRLLVTLGLENLIVVETADAILVANKENASNLNSIVKNLASEGYKEGIVHKKIYRPWGSYTHLVEDKRWQVKKIEVKPGGSLSLQMHHHRSEHWTVVEGTAKVEINGKIFILSENQSTFIPLGAKHRLSNPGQIYLSLIEVQSGEYLGEDDIVRFDDIYGRQTPDK